MLSSESSDLDSRTVQNTRLRALFQLLGCYKISVRLPLLESTLEAFQKQGNDRGVSVLTSVFYKGLFKEAAKANGDMQDLKLLLRHASEVWFPKTLNCLRDEDKFILDLVDSLSTSLALLQFVFFMEKNKAADAQILYTNAFVTSLNTSYFEPLVHTLTAGLQSLDE